MLYDARVELIIFNSFNSRRNVDIQLSSGLPWLSIAFHFLANLKCLQRCLGWRKIDNTGGEKLVPILAPRAPRSREREREQTVTHIATISPPGKQSEKR